MTPVERLKSPNFDVVVADGETGEVTMGLRQRLTDIQYGRADDDFGWMRAVA